MVGLWYGYSKPLTHLIIEIVLVKKDNPPRIAKLIYRPDTVIERLKMPAPGWKSVSIPEEMLDEIKKIIKKRPELGYRSITDFVSAAIRSHPDFREILEEETG